MILENVGKNYGQKAALKNLSVRIGEGEITAVLGESGAGKTTLLNVLAGLCAHTGRVDGEEGSARKRREDCSYLFQSAKLLPNLTAEGNLKFVLPQSEWGKIGEMLARVGLGGMERSRPSELSGGERQRVAVARAFLYPHRLLLMDEPFASLDMSLKRSMIGLVTELCREKGSTVVFVTHDVREAVLLADRALVLREGELVLDLPLPAPYPRDFFGSREEETALTRALMREE